jgi:hypothetical protein
MAKVYQTAVKGDITQAEFDKIAHSLMFADLISPVINGTGDDSLQIVVTSPVESEALASNYVILADDSQSETSIDISSGKFVEGNVVAVVCPTSEAQSDLRNFMTFYDSNGNNHWHLGVANTTQSQDYTPDLITQNRVIKMLTPAQIQSLGL